MSQQGPGGYGGGPPGQGGGPPGYGGPPPGYGGPPPGYGAQPGYGPGGPAPQPPPKKSNALLFVGLGCGLLLLLGVGGGLWWYLGVYKPAQEQAQVLQAAASGVVPGIASALNPSGASSPACGKAAACCRALLARTPARNATGNCDAFALLNDSICQQQYDALKRQAALVGANCD